MADPKKQSKKSINSIKSKKHLRKGSMIYKTGRSPYWHIRLRDLLLGRNILRSSKETTQLEAIRVAH